MKRKYINLIIFQMFSFLKDEIAKMIGGKMIGGKMIGIK